MSQFTLEVFFVMSLFVSLMLFFLAWIIAFLGYSLRRDHIIVHNIRQKAYQRKNEKYEELFGALYNSKGKKWREFLPDYYNIFYWLFFALQIGVLLTTIIKILLSCNTNSCCALLVWSIIILILQLCSVAATLMIRCNYFRKYENNIY